MKNVGKVLGWVLLIGGFLAVWAVTEAPPEASEVRVVGQGLAGVFSAWLGYKIQFWSGGKSLKELYGLQ